MDNILIQNNLSTMTILYIKVTDEYLLDYYRNLKVTENSGVDLPLPRDVIINNNELNLTDMGIKCAVSGVCGYDLVLRSSAIKYPIMLANHVGIIDNGYRGPIKAAFRGLNNSGSYLSSSSFVLNKGDRYVQLVQGTREPFTEIRIVDELPKAGIRGENGFGSTGIGMTTSSVSWYYNMLSMIDTYISDTLIYIISFFK